MYKQNKQNMKSKLIYHNSKTAKIVDNKKEIIIDQVTFDENVLDHRLKSFLYTHITTKPYIDPARGLTFVKGLYKAYEIKRKIKDKTKLQKQELLFEKHLILALSSKIACLKVILQGFFPFKEDDIESEESVDPQIFSKAVQKHIDEEVQKRISLMKFTEEVKPQPKTTTFTSFFPNFLGSSTVTPSSKPSKVKDFDQYNPKEEGSDSEDLK